MSEIFTNTETKAVKLQTMQCPNCGGNLKVQNASELLECIYCGSLVHPVKESRTKEDRTDKINTAASALAYMENFFEEYDWDAFLYAPSLTVDITDTLASVWRVSAANDPATWLLSFYAVQVPFIHKVDRCNALLDRAAKAYDADDPDAYTQFDAYRRVARQLNGAHNSVLQQLEKYTAKSVRYGVDPASLAKITAAAEAVRGASLPKTYNTLEQAPAVLAIIERRSKEVEKRLAAQGLDAASEYQKALDHLQNKRYVPALNLLLQLDGYRNCSKLSERINRYYLFGDALEICYNLYYFRKDEYDEGLRLYPVVDGKLSDKALITGIKSMLTNYADLLYFIKGNGKLYRFDLSRNGKAEKLFDGVFRIKNVYSSHKGRQLYALTRKEDADENTWDLTRLDLATGQLHVLHSKVKKLVDMYGEMLVFATKDNTFVLNTQSGAISQLTLKEPDICGFLDSCAIYTAKAPSAKNLNLYREDLQKPRAVMLEKNIHSFCGIAGNRLYYWVGNDHDRELISLKPDGTQRRQMPVRMDYILFEQGGWVYYRYKSGWNSALLRCRPDGTQRSVIASDLLRFEQKTNGNLYFIDDENSLAKVRLDGSGYERLCRNVKQVLSIREDVVVFLSEDHTGRWEDGGTYRVNSIYEVRFDGTGKSKLVYNATSASTHEENSVFFYNPQKELHRLDLSDRSIRKLIDGKKEKAPEALNIPFIVALCAMGFFLLIALIGLVAQSCSVAGIFGLMAVLAAIIAVFLKTNKEDEDE